MLSYSERYMEYEKQEDVDDTVAAYSRLMASIEFFSLADFYWVLEPRNAYYLWSIGRKPTILYYSLPVFAQNEAQNPFAKQVFDNQVSAMLAADLTFGNAEGRANRAPFFFTAASVTLSSALYYHIGRFDRRGVKLQTKNIDKQ